MTHSMEDMVLPPPTDQDVDTRLEQINQLKYFLATAPTHWDNHPNDPPLQRYSLPTGESVSCVRWHQGFFISGTDIVRSLVYRFHAFGRPVQNLKKFEEGVFSDLRNLKPGTDATLEEPKSSFLDLLYKHNCIRTQKKQKVFNWFSVPHDRLFLDALERDLKRNKLGAEATSEAVALPALSITLDTTQALFDEFRKNLLSDLDLNACLNGDRGIQKSTLSTTRNTSSLPTMKEDPPLVRSTNTIFGHFSLFEGSPTYKQRRRRTPHSSRSDHQHSPSHQHSASFRPSCWPYNSEHGMSSLASPKASSDFVDDPSRLYTCPLKSCGKIFKRLEHLKRHLRTHTMERPYLCGLCGKRFSRSDNLAQHKKTHKRRQRTLTENNSDGSDHSNNHSPLLHQQPTTPTLKNGRQQQKRQMQLSHYERSHNDVSHHQQNSYYSNTALNFSPPSSSTSSSTYYHNQHQGSMNWISSATIPPITVTNNNQGEHLSDFFPTMSASTSSSSISSCQSSPTAVQPLTSQLLVKAEQYSFDHRHQQQQMTPTTPTTSAMNGLLSTTLQPQPNHHEQQENRDWQFNMDWEQGSCPSSPQSSSLFIHPSASSTSSSSTSTSGYGSAALQHPPASAFYSTQFRMNYEQQQQQQQHQAPPPPPSTDQESSSLKSTTASVSSFYYPPTGFQEMAFRPMDSLMHF